MNIGAVYHRQKDYPQALDNLQAGLAHLDTISAPLQKAEGNIRLGALYRGLAEFDLAMEHFEKSGNYLVTTRICSTALFHLSGHGKHWPEKR